MTLPPLVRSVASVGQTNVIIWGDDEDNFAVTLTGAHELIFMQSTHQFITQRMFPLHAVQFKTAKLSHRVANAPRRRSPSPCEG